MQLSETIILVECEDPDFGKVDSEIPDPAPADLTHGPATLVSEESALVAMPVAALDDEKLRQFRKFFSNREINLILAPRVSSISDGYPEKAIAIELPDYVDSRIIVSLAARETIGAIFEPRCATKLENRAFALASQQTGIAAVICVDLI